jgi:hypothetical protein
MKPRHKPRPRFPGMLPGIPRPFLTAGKAQPIHGGMAGAGDFGDQSVSEGLYAG